MEAQPLLDLLLGQVLCRDPRVDLAPHNIPMHLVSLLIDSCFALADLTKCANVHLLVL